MENPRLRIARLIGIGGMIAFTSMPVAAAAQSEATPAESPGYFATLGDALSAKAKPDQSKDRGERADDKEDRAEERAERKRERAEERAERRGDQEDENSDDDNEKVCVRHATGSEQNPVVLIFVSERAREAHEAHGDQVVDDVDSRAECGAEGD